MRIVIYTHKYAHPPTEKLSERERESEWDKDRERERESETVRYTEWVKQWERERVRGTKGGSEIYIERAQHKREI